MQRTLTAASIRRLNTVCDAMISCDRCNHTCEIDGARFGWCHSAWRKVFGGGESDGKEERSTEGRKKV